MASIPIEMMNVVKSFGDVQAINGAGPFVAQDDSVRNIALHEPSLEYRFPGYGGRHVSAH